MVVCSKSYQEYLIQSLQDDMRANAYLFEALRTNNQALIELAVNNINEANMKKPSPKTLSKMRAAEKRETPAMEQGESKRTQMMERKYGIEKPRGGKKGCK